MTNQITSDTTFWIKFLHDSDLSIDNNTLLRYSTILTDRFSTIEDLVNIDENELIRLGITNKFDRIGLIKQARLFDDKENLPLIRQSAVSNGNLENWIGHKQSTPLNPKSKCNLSPSLLSRISFNDHSDELININKKPHIETPKRIRPIQKLTQSCQKKTPPTSAYGMRTLKSLSDTISLQKKILVGTDRLKRLTLTKSLFKRQTTLITKKITNLTNKVINPFVTIKKPKPRITIDDIKIATCQIVIDNSSKHNDEHQNSLNNNQSSIAVISNQNKIVEEKQIVPILVNKRFKLGVPTTFVTRSLANHSHLE